ncbi:HlyD family secretion protein [Thioalkalivibrio sp. HK1]|uniref:HlyD family secretion protein n=1 Tax=Thioalkalivibrio sp. HK1 TaxID=1469245 RepID=UPI0004708092|nr:HlyD family secretion protein [Thioalkalivibrio sp. HK1]
MPLIPRLRPRTLRILLLGVIPCLAVLLSLYFYVKSGRYITTENAYIKFGIVAISADISGRVEWVGVRDNAFVRKDQPLFRIDPRPFQIALDQADAELDLARSRIAHLRADYREALAQEAQARERVDFLSRRLDRGGDEDREQAVHELALARAKHRLLSQQVERALSDLGGDVEMPTETHPAFLQAQALRARASLDLENTQVLAPADGIVSNMSLEPGEYVGEGEAIFSLIEKGRVWVEANLKETQLTHIAEGQPATVKIDAYPDLVWKAKVSAIAPATGAEFSILPPQNATGNWVKVVQRIPVLLEMIPSPDLPSDADSPDSGYLESGSLRAGMSARISIDTGQEFDPLHRLGAFFRR